MKPTLASCLVLLALTTGLAGQTKSGQTKYGVTATALSGIDFDKIETYSWTYQGKRSLNKDVNAWIIAAIDRELKALGIRKTTSVLGNVLATYDSESRLDSGEPGEPDVTEGPPPRWVGVFIVSLLDSGNGRRPLLRMRMKNPIDVDPSQLQPEIDLAVKEMFALYPGRNEKNEK